MSSYQHDQHKWADAGLQLRLPVDLIPANQYSRLSNALPVIEGELTTRDGQTFIGAPVTSSFIRGFARTIGSLSNFVNVANTIYPSGLIAGQNVVINVIFNDPTQSNVVTLGSYSVTVTNVIGPTIFAFTGGVIPVTPSAQFNYPCFAQVVDGTVVNTLTNTPIDNLFRLNEAVPSLNGDRIATINGRIWHASLPAGNIFEEIVGPLAPGGKIPTQAMGFSGRPMAIIGFRFTLDSASWAIFADQNQMYKYRPGLNDSQIELVPLGNAPPTVPASASAGGTGNLNSTGGTGYDWRYTYQDGLALSESNPSPITMTSGGTSTTRPTTFTDPYNAPDDLFADPTYAIDGNLLTASVGSTLAFSHNNVQVNKQVSCSWQGWAQPSGAVTATLLNIVANMTVSSSDSGSGFGDQAFASATLSYSFDGGQTFQQLNHIQSASGAGNGTVTTGQQTYSVVIPSSAAYPNFILLGVGVANAIGAINPPETYSAQSSVSISIYDINTTVTQSGAVNALALVNKIGVVCVTPSPYPQHKFINLYRRGGSLTDAWRLVGQFQQSALSQGTCGVGTLEIDDNVSDTELSTANILQLDNDQPVTSVTIVNQPLSFIWGPVGIDVRVLGCGDPARPESVYFSKPGNADAWPPENYVEVSNPGTPIIAGCAFNTRTFAFSRESIFELVEGLGTGAVYTPFRTPSAHGLYTPWGLAVGPVMYFISKDGIYSTSGGFETSIVENDIKPLFPTYDTPGEAVYGCEAVDMTQPDNMRLRYHNDELYFSYIGSTTGTRQMLVYDILKKRWRGMVSSCGISEVYSEPGTTSSLLYGTVAGTVYQAGGNTDPSDLDVLESLQIISVTQTSTFSSGTYYARVVRYTALGPSAISYEFQLALDSTTAMQTSFPVGPAGTTQWWLYYGTVQGNENLRIIYNESALPASRTVQFLGAGGFPGTVPTTNANNQITVISRTGAHDQNAPLNQKQYGNVIIDLDPGGATVEAPVTITPYINGEVANEAALQVTGSGRQQIPLDLSDYFAFNTEYEVSWTRTVLGDGSVTDPILFQYDTLYFIEPAQVTHWQSQPTSFSFPGYVHVRDVYIAIRSTGPVVLTVTIDGGNEVLAYTIPSTSGQRLKQYVQLDSNKGLMYEFSLDSDPHGNFSFRVYEEDTEMRVKPFLGVLGYSLQRVVGGEVSA